MPDDDLIEPTDNMAEFIGDQLDIVEAAMRRDDTDTAIRALEHISSEGDADTAEALMDGMIAAGLKRAKAAAAAGDPAALELLRKHFPDQIHEREENC